MDSCHFRENACHLPYIESGGMGKRQLVANWGTDAIKKSKSEILRDTIELFVKHPVICTTVFQVLTNDICFTRTSLRPPLPTSRHIIWQLKLSV